VRATTISVLVMMPVDWREADPQVTAARKLKRLIERGIQGTTLPPLQNWSVLLDESRGTITVSIN
jgi:hypothetical protein